MDNSPISTEQVRVIALEEGLRSAVLLDSLRLKMLNHAVEWICDLTEMDVMDVRRELARYKSGQVAKNLATINAVRHLLRSDE
jgi:hypothetical protein